MRGRRAAAFGARGLVKSNRRLSHHYYNIGVGDDYETNDASDLAAALEEGVSARAPDGAPDVAAGGLDAGDASDDSSSGSSDGEDGDEGDKLSVPEDLALYDSDDEYAMLQRAAALAAVEARRREARKRRRDKRRADRKLTADINRIELSTPGVGFGGFQINTVGTVANPDLKLSVPKSPYDRNKGTQRRASGALGFLDDGSDTDDDELDRRRGADATVEGAAARVALAAAAGISSQGSTGVFGTTVPGAMGGGAPALSFAMAAHLTSKLKQKAVVAVKRASQEEMAEAVYWASVRGDAAEVHRLIEAGASPNLYQSDQGWSALFGALRYNHLDAAKALLAGGADVNFATPDGTTALHECANSGKADVTQLLLYYGADSKVRDRHGWEPLMLAAFSYNDDVTKLLMHHRGLELSHARQLLESQLASASKALALEQERAANGAMFSY